jgi:hypothetical protein
MGLLIKNEEWGTRSFQRRTMFTFGILKLFSKQMNNYTLYICLDDYGILSASVLFALFVISTHSHSKSQNNTIHVSPLPLLNGFAYSIPIQQVISFSSAIVFLLIFNILYAPSKSNTNSSKPPRKTTSNFRLSDILQIKWISIALTISGLYLLAIRHNTSMVSRRDIIIILMGSLARVLYAVTLKSSRKVSLVYKEILSRF